MCACVCLSIGICWLLQHTILTLKIWISLLNKINFFVKGTKLWCATATINIIIIELVIIMKMLVIIIIINMIIVSLIINNDEIMVMMK